MMTGLFTVMCFITSAHAPEWEISGDPAEMEIVEAQVSELRDAQVRRGTSPGGSRRLFVRLPGELHLRDVNGLFAILNRGHIEGRVPPPRPYYCPYGGADRWREGLSGPPTVGIFGTPAEIERVRASNPNWNYMAARFEGGRTGVVFVPGTSEDNQDSYAEFLSQVRAEFQGIDIALVEQVTE